LVTDADFHGVKVSCSDDAIVEAVMAHFRDLPGWLAFKVDAATVEVIALEARSAAAEERLARAELHAFLARGGVAVRRRQRLGEW
jgi:hypothetical protein